MVKVLISHAHDVNNTKLEWPKLERQWADTPIQGSKECSLKPHV